jgi:Fe-S cluster biosynthesis and repair protein YggX
MDLYQQYIHKSRYARWDYDKKRRENWDETVSRYVNFMSEHLQKNLNYNLDEETKNKIYSYIHDQKVMPSMRALMTAGKALERDEISSYNCSFSFINSPRVFDEALYILSCGVGLGYSVERQYITKLPEVPDELYETDTVIVVADSRIGWAKSLKELIAMLYAGQIPKFDVSKVRPAGAPLKVFGGRACLTGDTIVYKDRKKTRGYNELTIKELYQLQHSEGFWKGKPNHFKDVKLRSLDEKTGMFFRNNVLNVIHNGIAPVYEILTENGYRIKSTDNHRFMNENCEYQFVSDFNEGDLIAVNGSKEKKVNNCIDCGKLIFRRAKRCKKCANINQLKDDCLETTARQRKECRSYLETHSFCENCGESENRLEIHHVDKNPKNNDHENLQLLCSNCHSKTHASQETFGDPYSHKYMSFDKIISIKYVGTEDVYDLQMEAPNHNFIANGFISHNSGSNPLLQLFNNVINIFKKAKGRKLNSAECSDIMCHIAQAIVCGSVRRSALICLSNLSDERMRNYKNGQWWVENPQRSMANISVAYTEKPDIGMFMKEWQSLYESKSGERGIFNRVGAKKHIEKNAPSRDDSYDFGINPCTVGDTLVAVADGRHHVKIKDLVDNNEDNIPVYCLDDNMKLVVRNMVHPRITGYDVPIYKVTLDNGESVRVTGNHKFRMTSFKYKEVKDLVPGDSLFSIKIDKIESVSDLKVSSYTIEENGYVTKKCEFCKNDFSVLYENREISFCSDECADKYFNRPITEFEGLSDYYKVVSVELDGYENVYNGTVDEFHNFFIGGFSEITEEGKKKFCYINNANCGEILLRGDSKVGGGGGLCNLSEVICRENDTLEELKNKVEIATILGTFQSTLTNFRYVRKGWQLNAEEERLLGVSLTGIMDCSLLNKNIEETEQIATELKNVAINTNKKWATLLNINPSVANSTIKPAGTTSQLNNTSSGLHSRFSQYYLRAVRNDSKDPLSKFMKENGFYCEQDVMNPTNDVFYFPIKSPEGCIVANNETAIEQLEKYLLFKNNWCQHNPSITVYVKEHEWLEVGAWVYKHFDDIIGITFLPYSNHVYKQAPYTEITKEEYEEWVKKTPMEINWEILSKYEEKDYTTSSQELSCFGGACEINF